MKLREQVEKFMTQRVTADGGWDDQIDAYTKFVNIQLKKQRQMCADDVFVCNTDAGKTPLARQRILEQACLDATGENDDK